MVPNAAAAYVTPYAKVRSAAASYVAQYSGAPYAEPDPPPYQVD